jgi:hypothetical protein
MTHGLGITSATAPGPALSLPDPISELVAVGSVMDGPMPQISPLDAAGEM